MWLFSISQTSWGCFEGLDNRVTCLLVVERQNGLKLGYLRVISCHWFFSVLPIDFRGKLHMQINTRIWSLFISLFLVISLYPNASKHMELITAFNIILVFLSLEELILHLVNRIIWKDCLVPSVIIQKLILWHTILGQDWSRVAETNG